jgi:hypothetical protein
MLSEVKTALDQSDNEHLWDKLPSCYYNPHTRHVQSELDTTLDQSSTEHLWGMVPYGHYNPQTTGILLETETAFEWLKGDLVCY